MEDAYKELKETQLQLQNAEKLASIGQLAAGVAHEINNPLGTILLYASMLKDDTEDTNQEKVSVDDIKMIIEETNRCKGIVSNLLNFARQGKLKIEKENIVKITKNIIKSTKLNPLFKDVKILFNSELVEENYFIDSDQIKQVIVNLLNNACESLEESESKQVTINLYKNNEYLNIEITDTGVGIDNQNMSKLFTPFFTTKKIGKGTGLGLAISYGIIKMHKGNLTVKSEIGKGSTFSVQLPNNKESKLNFVKELVECN